jgi:hypothetical protein
MNHFISLQQAQEMTERYRQNRVSILQPPYQQGNVLAISESFDRAAFDSVLAQPGCVGLRIYYGMDPSLQVHAIIVGYNENNEDMLPVQTGFTAASSTDEGETNIIEEGNRCPDFCAPDSPLNTP